MYVLRSLIVYCMFLMLGTSQSALAKNDFGSMMFIWRQTFGIDTHFYLATRKPVLSSFLPYSTLVFKDPWLKEPISFPELPSQYVPIITQHGQRVLVRDEFIWPKSFKENYQEHEIAVHQPIYLCETVSVSCSETNGIIVHNNDVLDIEEENELYVKLNKMEIRGGDSITISGYLSKLDFINLEKAGKISDTRKKFPRLLHYKTNLLRSLSTDCGVRQEQIDSAKIGAEASAGIQTPGLWDFLAGMFKLSITTKADFEKKQILTVSYGGSDIATEVYEIVVYYPNQDGEFFRNEHYTNPVKKKSFFVFAELNCLFVGQNTEKIYVKKVAVRDASKLLGALEFSDFYNLSNEELRPSAVEFKIFTLNGGYYYMTSLSTNFDYSMAIKMLVDRLGDVSLAHIILGHFNRSCLSKLDQCAQILPIHMEGVE